MGHSKDDRKDAEVKNKKETEENYGFIKEERVPQRKWQKRMKVLRMIGLVIGFGVLFGAIARCSYGISDYVIQHFINKQEREPVELRPTPTMIVQPGNPTGPVIDEKAFSEYEAIIKSVNNAAAALNPSLVTVGYMKKIVDPVFSDITESVHEVSGVVVADNGVEYLIYTSYSKMRATDYDQIYVTFSGGKKERAYVYAMSPDADTVLLSVDYKDFRNYEKEAVRVVKFGHSSEMEPGSAVIAVGFPNGRTSSVDMGMIVSRAQKVYVRDNSLEILETNMYGGRGESGVLINSKGEVVGFITEMFGVGGNCIEAIAFDKIETLIWYLVNKTSYPVFGAVFRDLNDDVLKQLSVQNGIIIEEVIADTTASAQLFRKGDIITEIGGTPITSVEEFFSLYTTYRKGADLKMTFYRNGKKYEKSWKIN